MSQKSPMANPMQNVGRHCFQLSPKNSFCAQNVLLQKWKSDKIFSNPLKTCVKKNGQKHVAHILCKKLRLAFLFWDMKFVQRDFPIERLNTFEFPRGLVVVGLWHKSVQNTKVGDFQKKTKNWHFFWQGDF